MKVLTALATLLVTGSLSAAELGCQIEVQSGDERILLAKKTMAPNDLGIDWLDADHEGLAARIWVNTMPADGARVFVRSILGRDSGVAVRAISSSSVEGNSYNTRLEYTQTLQRGFRDWTGYFYYSCQFED